MKVIVAILAACLAGFCFYNAYGIQGVTFGRLGYLAAGVISTIVVFAPFVKKHDDEQSRKF